jgi:PleD family two-component response regulator
LDPLNASCSEKRPIVAFESKVFKKLADHSAMGSFGEVFSGKPRILVVDDDGDLRLTLCEFLQSCNFVVSSARDGSEAINLIQSRKLLSTSSSPIS